MKGFICFTGREKALIIDGLIMLQVLEERREASLAKFLEGRGNPPREKRSAIIARILNKVRVMSVPEEERDG